MIKTSKMTTATDGKDVDDEGSDDNFSDEGRDGDADENHVDSEDDERGGRGEQVQNKTH